MNVFVAPTRREHFAPASLWLFTLVEPSSSAAQPALQAIPRDTTIMVHQRFFVLPALLVASLSGCAMDASSDGDEEDGYVLLARGARESMTIDIDGFQGAPALPLAIPAGETARLSVRGGETREIAAQPGVLAYVHDQETPIEWLTVGRDVLPDRLLIHGSEASARDLALLLGATATSRGDGLWSVNTPDIFTKTSFMDAPDGLLDAIPDAALSAGDLSFNDAPSSAIVGLAPSRGAAEGGDSASDDDAPGRREALIVGLYTSASSSLRLDASGRFSLRDACSADAQEGFYFVARDIVVLQSRGATPIALAIDIDKQTLIPPSGDRLRPLLPDLTVTDERTPHGVATNGSVGAKPLTADR